MNGWRSQGRRHGRIGEGTHASCVQPIKQMNVPVCCVGNQQPKSVARKTQKERITFARADEISSATARAMISLFVQEWTIGSLVKCCVVSWWWCCRWAVSDERKNVHASRVRSLIAPAMLYVSYLESKHMCRAVEDNINDMEWNTIEQYHFGRTVLSTVLRTKWMIKLMNHPSQRIYSSVCIWYVK